jgi:hypothetical protein
VGSYLFTTASIPALVPTQPPIQWLPAALYRGVKRPGREADHSPPSSAKVKNVWSYTFTSQYGFKVWCTVEKRRDSFAFTFSRYTTKKITLKECIYISPNVVRFMKPRKIRLMEHVARMENVIYAYRILVGKSEGNDGLGELGVDGKSKGKGKNKVVLGFILTEHHAMNAYWGSGGVALRIL